MPAMRACGQNCYPGKKKPPTAAGGIQTQQLAACCPAASGPRAGKWNRVKGRDVGLVLKMVSWDLQGNMHHSQGFLVVLVFVWGWVFFLFFAIKHGNHDLARHTARDETDGSDPNMDEPSRWNVPEGKASRLWQRARILLGRFVTKEPNI